MNPAIKTIARKVRAQAKQAARRTPAKYVDEVCPDDLMGMCARASWMLVKKLRAAGFKCDFVLGDYQYDEHCYVVVDGHVVDVTASQFGKPPIYITQLGEDKDYHAFAYNEEANDILAAWPIAQRPKERVQNAT